VPSLTPYTTPVPDTVATAVLLLLHTPSVAASLNGVVEPTHRLVEPEMLPTDGAGVTVTAAVATQEPII
jgi:hypothetical protein